MGGLEGWVGLWGIGHLGVGGVLRGFEGRNLIAKPSVLPSTLRKAVCAMRERALAQMGRGGKQ